MVGDQSLQLLTIGTTRVLGSGEDEALFLEVTNVVIFPGGGSSISQTGDDARTNVSLGPLLDLPVGTWEETTTPLPAALPLFASGLGGLVLLGWRRKRKAQAAA
jgi:hypothetical protein